MRKPLPAEGHSPGPRPVRPSGPDVPSLRRRGRLLFPLGAGAEAGRDTGRPRAPGFPGRPRPGLPFRLEKGRVRLAEMSGDFLTTKLDSALGWARKFSLFHYPFITACCGMEYMSTACAHFDLDRFGAGLTRFSPRQADLLMVVGTISMKLAPVLRTVYDQMLEPKWVIAFGACTVSGGIYQNYAVVQGIDKIVPVDVYIPGCPPRPEMVLDGLLKLQERIQSQRQDWRWGKKP